MSAVQRSCPSASLRFPYRLKMPALSEQETLTLLREGEITSPILSPSGSNYTFLTKVRNGSAELGAVYKPRDGEAPLWDFPGGTLYKREYAAYLLSQILGWDFIPATIIRDGPYGVGSLQLFIEHDPRINYFSIRESDPDALRTIACFDLVTNNADRKVSHCIQGPDGRIWGIDHGLTFHSVVKVRTAIWDFAGEPIPEAPLKDLSDFLEPLRSPEGSVLELVGLLDQQEVEALEQRIDWLLENRTYPGLRRPRR